MKKEDVASRLSEHRDRLMAMGVESLALFGSTARDVASESSDIDLLVSFNRPMTLFDYADIEQYISQMMGNAKIDLVNRDAVLDELKDSIFSEAMSCL